MSIEYKLTSDFYDLNVKYNKLGEYYSNTDNLSKK